MANSRARSSYRIGWSLVGNIFAHERPANPIEKEDEMATLFSLYRQVERKYAALDRDSRHVRSTLRQLEQAGKLKQAARLIEKQSKKGGPSIEALMGLLDEPDRKRRTKTPPAPKKAGRPTTTKPLGDFADRLKRRGKTWMEIAVAYRKEKDASFPNGSKGESRARDAWRRYYGDRKKRA